MTGAVVALALASRSVHQALASGAAQQVGSALKMIYAKRRRLQRDNLAKTTQRPRSSSQGAGNG